jgi:chloride channel 3/4/5
VKQFLDASQIWVLLILTGLAAGLFAAAIDVVSDWLGDLKTGFCSAGPDGGHFYLNKYFCCFGYDELSQCRDWVPWSFAFHITSAAGKWVVEYLFFLIFAVSVAICLMRFTRADTYRWCLPLPQVCW